MRSTALAVSIADPPPTATNASQGPAARARSMALSMLASVGSTWALSWTWASIPNAAICSATRSGAPVAATPGSVMTRTLRAPVRDRSWPTSSEAPGPNFSWGAP
jgi:hypothetical protein